MCVLPALRNAHGTAYVLCAGLQSLIKQEAQASQLWCIMCVLLALQNVAASQGLLCRPVHARVKQQAIHASQASLVQSLAQTRCRQDMPAICSTFVAVVSASAHSIHTELLLKQT
jgi:hypothetical protein